MEWIFVDSTRSGVFRLGILGADIRVREVKGRSHEILPALARLAPRDRIVAAQGICVVSGPGSFSAVRTGTLIANILARVLKKPLVAIKATEAQDLKALRDGLAQGVYPSTGYAAPEYDAEPNITIKKST